MPLCEEVMLSFAAENEARMEAMIAARSNVVRKLDELVASFRRPAPGADHRRDH